MSVHALVPQQWIAIHVTGLQYLRSSLLSSSLLRLCFLSLDLLLLLVLLFELLCLSLDLDLLLPMMSTDP